MCESYTYYPGARARQPAASAGLEQARRRAGGDHALEREAGGREERGVLLLGALAAAGHEDEHLQVVDLRRRRSWFSRDDAFDRQHAAFRIHRAAAVGEDRGGPAVVAVVQDEGEEVEVAAGGDGVGEVA